MNQYVSGATIKQLRENKHLSQQQLAEKINVSAKAVSKWETRHGYPDISLMKPLADALGVSIIELFTGEIVENRNTSFSMLRMKFYVCPVCGNIIYSSGDAVVSCCGIALRALEAKPENSEHHGCIDQIEDEFYISIPHEMSKNHHISFIAAIKDDGCEIRKLYAEGNADAYFKICRTKYLVFYCSQHGLFRVELK